MLEPDSIGAMNCAAACVSNSTASGFFDKEFLAKDDDGSGFEKYRLFVAAILEGSPTCSKC